MGSPIYNEQWLARKLGLPGSWDAGLTTADQRQETMRQWIITEGISERVVGRAANRGGMTAAKAFQRLYGAPVTSDELQLAGHTGTEG